MKGRKGKRPEAPAKRRTGGIDANPDEIARAIFSAVKPPDPAKRIRKKRASKDKDS